MKQQHFLDPVFQGPMQLLKNKTQILIVTKSDEQTKAPENTRQYRGVCVNCMTCGSRASVLLVTITKPVC